MENAHEEPTIISGAELLKAGLSNDVYEFAEVAVFGPIEEGGVKVMIDKGSEFKVAGTDMKKVHLNVGGVFIQVPIQSFSEIKVTQ